MCRCPYCKYEPKTGTLYAPDLNTHLVRETESRPRRAPGWYCWDPELADWPSDPSWTDCGNGPELHVICPWDNIHGPVKTEREAINTVREMFREENKS